MKIPWLRRSFLKRRWLDRLFLDAPDFLVRAMTGRKHWPPYSLRAFVGGAQRFDQVGKWFLTELTSMGLFSPGANILDIGCGCGRLAYTLAADPALRGLNISYTGMDIDRASVEWCQKNITPLNRRFTFFHADCINPSYNPHGTLETAKYRFPLEGGSFQLILLTSVCTHVLEPELRNYFGEIARLLAKGGVAYVTVFLYSDADEAVAGIERHGIAFPFVQGNYALNRMDYPTNAVAYHEAFVRDLVREVGLEIQEPTRYGLQDLLLLSRPV